jgi:hypothetical protein
MTIYYYYVQQLQSVAIRCFLGPIQLRAASLIVDSFVERAQRSEAASTSDSGGVTRGLLLNNTVCSALMALPLLSLARFVVAPRCYSPHSSLDELIDVWRRMPGGAAGLTHDDALLLVDIFKVCDAIHEPVMTLIAT